MLLLGCHLSAAKGYAYMGREAVSIGANTFQFFTRNPRGGSAKALDPEDVTRFRDFAAQAGIPVILAHAPYTLNGCSGDENVRRFARETMADDLRRMEATPGNLYNFHPGSHVGQGVEAGITLIAQMLNQTLFPEMTTTVLLETMAGKGSEVGGSFEELRAILDAADRPDRLGVCLDTCHVHDGGYDIANDLDGVLEEFDRVIGLQNLRAIHLNDSKNERGARKDRHAVIGGGKIGLKALAAVVRHPALRQLPMVLETPNELPGYAAEIQLLRREEANA